jgi:hypothetical protein
VRSSLPRRGKEWQGVFFPAVLWFSTRGKGLR